MKMNLSLPTPRDRSRSLALLAASRPGRAALVALALATAGAGLYAGWHLLAAAGLTSFVIGPLACLAMCGAGMCANRFGNDGGCRSADKTPPDTNSQP